MRIAPPDQAIPAYVRREPASVRPLSPEASKALIASGVFDHGEQNVFAASAQGPVKNPATAPYLSPQASSPFEELRQVAELSLPHLEQAQIPIADAVALLVDGPKVLNALANRNIGKTEKVIVLGTNAIRVLKLGNELVHIPYLGPTLDAAAVVFKLGDQVFLADEQHTAPAR
ncbi:hypothetical protein DYQ86_01990 [Acidobacteria bacterium AB60]|nr:hypothetical protein DYQ86_01990 [Acidobacteria bacterium AB60]